tara:strand:- start:4912 stop:5034 length:123 start_codon:yes stop_codon:yes gene_type:complete
MKITSRTNKPELYQAYKNSKEEFQSLLIASLAAIVFFALT